MFLPTARGFDEYFGIPFSQDMGTSWWASCVSRGNTSEPCDPPPTGFYQRPLPLMRNTTVVAQPAGLYTLAARYAAAATGFMRGAADAGAPFPLPPFQPHTRPRLVQRGGVRRVRAWPGG